MCTTFQAATPKKQPVLDTMRALVFRGPNHIAVERVSIPRPGPGEAVIRVTLTTICGTDLHILKGEYPVRSDLVIGARTRWHRSRVGCWFVGLRCGRSCPRRGHYTVRAMRLLLERRLVAVRWPDRRLEVRKYRRWRASGIPVGAERTSKLGDDSRRAER